MMQATTIHHPTRHGHRVRARWVAAAAGLAAFAGVTVGGIERLTDSDAPPVPSPVTGWAAIEQEYTHEQLTEALTNMVAAATGLAVPPVDAPPSPADAAGRVSESAGGQVPARTFADLQSGASGLVPEPGGGTADTLPDEQTQRSG